jgi:hypothetical protein
VAGVPRRAERKLKLTMEWGAKAAYGWALGKATAGAYEKPIFTSVSVVKDKNGDNSMRALPRYQPFTKAAIEVAGSGEDFESIAGNKGVILVSLHVDKAIPDLGLGEKRLFEQLLLTRPGTRRLTLLVPVGKLAVLLRWAAKYGAKVEHVFDY